MSGQDPRTSSSMSFQQLLEFFASAYKIFQDSPDFLIYIYVRDADNFDYRLERPHLVGDKMEHKMQILTYNWRGRAGPDGAIMYATPSDLEKEKATLLAQVLNQLNANNALDPFDWPTLETYVIGPKTTKVDPPPEPPTTTITLASNFMCYDKDCVTCNPDPMFCGPTENLFEELQ